MADGTCTCKAGWVGKYCSKDVDECANDPDICGANAQCHNKLGSHECICDAGYMMGKDKTCEGMCFKCPFLHLKDTKT